MNTSVKEQLINKFYVHFGEEAFAYFLNNFVKMLTELMILTKNYLFLLQIKMLMDKLKLDQFTKILIKS